MRTHDMPAFAAAFSGDATGGVHDYRRLLAEAVGHPVGEAAADVLDAAMERLAASDAYLVVADLDDLLGETAPHNVPGRVLESTWRRRLPRPASAIVNDRDVRRRVKLLANRQVGRYLVTTSERSSNPIGEMDLHLFNEGTHRHLHRCLGAHPDADRHVVRGVGAERRVASTCSATSTAGAASRCTPCGARASGRRTCRAR